MDHTITWHRILTYYFSINKFDYKKPKLRHGIPYGKAMTQI